MPQLHLENDGPAVLGANVTFFSSLVHYSIYSKLTYIFNDGVQDITKLTSTSSNVSLSLAFPMDQYVEGKYCMNVTVEALKLLVFEKEIAKNYTCFELKSMLLMLLNTLSIFKL